jgi:hypothetical protein
METVSAEDGTRIAYDRTGRSEPVILVAGAFSYRTYSGQVKLAGLLSQHLRRSDADTAPACRRVPPPCLPPRLGQRAATVHHRLRPDSPHPRRDKDIRHRCTASPL